VCVTLNPSCTYAAKPPPPLNKMKNVAIGIGFVAYALSAGAQVRFEPRPASSTGPTTWIAAIDSALVENGSQRPRVLMTTQPPEPKGYDLCSGPVETPDSLALVAPSPISVEVWARGTSPMDNHSYTTWAPVTAPSRPDTLRAKVIAVTCGSGFLQSIWVRRDSMYLAILNQPTRPSTLYDSLTSGIYAIEGGRMSPALLQTFWPDSIRITSVR
jgi:hypothetical protein